MLLNNVLQCQFRINIQIHHTPLIFTSLSVIQGAILIVIRRHCFNSAFSAIEIVRNLLKAGPQKNFTSHSQLAAMPDVAWMIFCKHNLYYREESLTLFCFSKLQANPQKTSYMFYQLFNLYHETTLCFYGVLSFI